MITSVLEKPRARDGRWLLAAATVVPISLLYLPAPLLGHAALQLLAGLVGIAGVMVAARRWPRRGWGFVALGLAAFVPSMAGYGLYYIDGSAPAFPAPADLVYLGGYLPFLAGLWKVVHPGRDRAGWNALISTVAFVVAIGLLTWAVVMHDTITGVTFGTNELLTVAFPMLDLVALAIVTHTLVDARRPNMSSLLLWGGLLAAFAASVAYAAAGLQGGYVPGDLLDVGYMASWAFVGAAALHPGAAGTERGIRGAGTFGLALLGFAGALALVLLVVQSAATTQTTLVVMAFSTGALWLGFAGTMSSSLRETRWTARRATAAKGESDRRFRGAFEQSSVGMAIMSTEGIYLEVNERLCHILHRDRNDLLGRSFLDVTHPEDRVAGLTTMATLRSGSHPTEPYLKRYVTPAGTTVWAEVAVSAVREAEGPVLYYVSLVHDETLRRALEDRIAQMQRVELIGELAGAVAHDFNNIVAVIQAAAAMLEEDTPAGDPRLVEIAYISDAAQRATSLTRRLLCLARDEMSQPSIVDANAAVRDAARLVAKAMPQVDIDVITAADPSGILIDPTELDQIMVNLAMNARDAMPHGGRLEIETRTTTVTAADERPGLEAGDYLVIAVTDTGEGMPPHVVERVFEPFFTTKPSGVGTGLGLASVFGIVKHAGGYIDVSSIEGVGSTFTIYLPLQRRP
ncbi:MAG TPA: ATP-binding protein [Actinomycetota bacterium]|nr:ATP-binding protein [Actinomycetota bacterium]